MGTYVTARNCDSALLVRTAVERSGPAPDKPRRRALLAGSKPVESPRAQRAGAERCRADRTGSRRPP